MNKIIAHRIPMVIVIIGGMFALLGVEAVIPARADWREVPTDKQQINMQVPGMERWHPGYWKEVDEETTYNRGTAYYTKWRMIGEYGIHAYLTYQKRVRGFTYYTLKEQIRNQHRKDFRSFDGDKKIYDSKLGKFEYMHFSLKTGQVKRKCIGFARMFSGNRAAIYGQYCVSRDKPLYENIVGPLIDSIDLDYQAPGRSDAARDSASSANTADIRHEKILTRAEQGDAGAQYTLKGRHEPARVVSPALGGERDDEIIKYGRSECLVKYHGRGKPIQLADEMDIDLEEICDCEGRALTKMSTLGQDIFMTNYNEFDLGEHLPFSEDDLNRRATYINQHCPKYFVFGKRINDRILRSYKGKWIRLVTPEGIISEFVVRDGVWIKKPN